MGERGVRGPQGPAGPRARLSVWAPGPGREWPRAVSGVLQLCPCPAPQPRASGVPAPPNFRAGLVSGLHLQRCRAPPRHSSYSMQDISSLRPSSAACGPGLACRGRTSCTEASGESGQGPVSTQSTQVPGVGVQGTNVGYSHFFWLHHVGSQFPNRGPAWARHESGRSQPQDPQDLPAASVINQAGGRPVDVT